MLGNLRIFSVSPTIFVTENVFNCLACSKERKMSTKDFSELLLKTNEFAVT